LLLAYVLVITMGVVILMELWMLLSYWTPMRSSMCGWRMSPGPMQHPQAPCGGLVVVEGVPVGATIILSHMIYWLIIDTHNSYVHYLLHLQTELFCGVGTDKSYKKNYEITINKWVVFCNVSLKPLWIFNQPFWCSLSPLGLTHWCL